MERIVNPIWVYAEGVCGAHLGSGGPTGHCPTDNPPGASPHHHPHRFDHRETSASFHSLTA